MSEETLVPEVEQNLPAEGQAKVEFDSQVETPEASEPAEPETADKPEKKPIFNEEQQSILNKKMAEAKREKRELEAQLEEFKSKAQQEAPEPQRPIVKESWEYETPEEHAEALANQKFFDAKQADRKASEEAKVAEEAAAANRAAQEQYTGYLGNAEKSGIDSVKANDAANRLVDWGFGSNGLGQYLLSQDDSGVLIPYIASNIDVAEDLISTVTSNPYGVDKVLDGIRLKAEALKPKPTNAPDPIESVGSAAVPPAQKGPKGVKFE